jgi:hypothetical protein
MAITGYEWEYHFGLNGTVRNKDDPYSEYRHLTVLGKLLHPSDIALEDMRITFIPEVEMEKENRQDFKPAGFGSLEMRDEWIDGVFGMPMSALPPVLTALAGGHHRYIDFYGSKKRYRKAEIRSYRFTANFDLEDYEPALLRGE